jgi:hypothetical protein
VRYTIAISILGSLILCLLIAGCGGSDGSGGGNSSSSSSGSSTSSNEASSGGSAEGSGESESSSIDKATFVAQADEICEQTSGKLAAEVTAILQTADAKPNNDTFKGRTATQVTMVKTALIPGLEAELEEIRELGIPSEGEQQVQAFLKSIQKVIDKAEANPADFAVSPSPYEGAELAGRRYGLTECPIAVVEAG